MSRQPISFETIMITMSETSDLPGEQSIDRLAPALAELRPKPMRQARLLVGNPSVAEDLVQETLLTVFEQHAQHNGGAPFFLGLPCPLIFIPNAETSSHRLLW